MPLPNSTEIVEGRYSTNHLSMRVEAMIQISSNQVANCAEPSAKLMNTNSLLYASSISARAVPAQIRWVDVQRGAHHRLYGLQAHRQPCLASRPV